MASYTKETLARADDAMAQLASLRDQVDSLMRDRLSPMLSSAGDRVSAMAQDAAKDVQSRADGLAGRIRYQPLSAVVITAIVAFVLGRATR